MPGNLPSIIVTGASGFVGRHFLEAAKEEYLIYAIARRSQREVGILPHPNIKWIQVDIGDWNSLKRVMHNIKEQGGADFILHLAAYYDFSNSDSPEYVRTNVNGTRHMLEQAKWLCVKRFVFASSLTVSNFPRIGEAITEKSAADAVFPYARSKRRGEDMVREYSSWFQCTIIRLAAVFSDWCEYGPVYVFLSTWLSSKWNARILGGHGESAVTYIHISDLTRMFLIILRNSNSLPQLDLYIASPNGSTSHREMFGVAVRYYFGRDIRPICVPKIIAYPGVISRYLLGRTIGRVPFERPWMLRYVDLKLNVDSSYTRGNLSWNPTPRYHLVRRLLFLIENMKSHPYEWSRKNEAALKREILRPSLLIYEAIVSIKDRVIEDFLKYILSPKRSREFKHYQELDTSMLKWAAELLYQLLAAAVRTGDRMLMLNYISGIAQIRFEEGFDSSEVCSALLALRDTVIAQLLSRDELKGMEQMIHDRVSMTIQLTIDEVEDLYERFVGEIPLAPSLASEGSSGEPAFGDLKEMINDLEGFYKPAPDEQE